MEISMLTVHRPLWGCCSRFSDYFPFRERVMKSRKMVLRAQSSRGGGEAVERSDSEKGRYRVSATEVTILNNSPNEAPEFPVGALVRFGYEIGIYGAMALAGRFICSVSGIDGNGGFDLSLDAIVEGVRYAAPPIMALLFILNDEVVKLSPHARAIRDVEDEELRSFFFGMPSWQFLLTVAASSVGEELFYRAAVQGAVAEIFLRGGDLVADARGMASMAAVLPPFAQAFAAVTTAALTGSLYYMAASPKEPTYVIAPELKPHAKDLRKLFAGWNEERQMKKIYSPMLEALLALYLGFEWIQTNNILAPILTHGIYSTVILGHLLWKMNRSQLRDRVRQQIHKPETDEISNNS